MDIGKIITGTVSSEKILINSAEIAVRLGVPRDYDNGIIKKCTELVIKAAQTKYCYTTVKVDLSEQDTVNFGFSKFHSANLFKNLTGCGYAFIMAVTLGISVDRLVSKLAVTSETESFIADGIASALAESVIDRLSEMLGKSFSLKPRFSPGYGDFELSSQPEILSVLTAQKLIGITLGENLLMVPKKSITAVQGIIRNN